MTRKQKRNCLGEQRKLRGGGGGGKVRAEGNVVKFITHSYRNVLMEISTVNSGYTPIKL